MPLHLDDTVLQDIDDVRSSLQIEPLVKKKGLTLPLDRSR